MSEIVTAGGTMHINDKTMQGFYKMLEKDNIQLEDVLKNVSSVLETQEEVNSVSDLGLYKIKVDDGWLWIERGFYHDIVEYIEKSNGSNLFDFFASLERNCFGRFRIVKQEERATAFSKKMVLLIHEVSNLIVLSNYESYEIIDENGEEIIV